MPDDLDNSASPESQMVQIGAPLESVLERRERFANRFDYDFGRERVFPELVEALLEEVPEGARIVEAGAATGLLTEPLLGRAGHVTALEPSEGMLRRLLAKHAADAPHLRMLRGMAEDLAHNELFDVAVVTFTPRRGVGLLRLLQVLASHVTEKVIVLVDDDPAMEWAFLARAATVQGFDVTLRFVSERAAEPGVRRRAVIVTAVPTDEQPFSAVDEVWEVEARELDVPYPTPRGAATRLVRYFLAGGDRAILVKTDPRGIERLYGNLRTAAHRIGRDEVTVRRADEGIHLVRLPKPVE